ncbi:MAG: domain containing rane protein [Chloroflexi bacterium]|nr:domain containing rane protein [Chloroflexota bacterium]
MKTVQQLMSARAEAGTVTVSPDETVYHALMLMANHNTGAVMVVENGRMVGIFTERDYARKVILMGRCSPDTKIREIMTRELLTINPETTLEECMALMTKWHIRHLPVLSEGQLVGIVSMRDVVQAIISKRDETIQDLEKYIMGQGYAR